MKDMTSVANTMMTDEEKAEMEAQMNGGEKPATSVGGSASPAATPIPATSPSRPSSPAAATTATAAPSSPPRPDPSHMSSSLVVQEGEKQTSSTPSLSPSIKEHEREAAKEAAARRKKQQAEQREKVRELEKERRKVMEERVKTLTAKAIERLRPFVDAKHPGEKDDPETMAFEAKIRLEAEDLKLESFGIEVRISLSSMTACSMFSATTYHRKCLHDEGVLLPQVQEISRHVRAACSTLTQRYLMHTPALASFHV